MAVQRLFILSPTVVFAARVNQSAFVYPIGNVTYDTVTTGAFGNILPGMTVLFGSTAGADDKGRQRIRSATSSLLLIGRSSQGTKDGEVDLDDNDYISVLSDYRVWSKIPAMDVTDGDNPIIYKDNNLLFTDQTDEIPPKANIAGGAAAGTINSGTSLLTVTFNGSGSYAVADGATISSYSWNVGGGTITAGTGTNTITATFPAGLHWVSLTVTDSNDKTHLMRVPVYAFNPASPTTVPFQVVEHTITQEGQRCAFRILADIPASTYPDGTLVIFWEGEPSGPTDRTNVKFWGWHQSDSNNVSAGRTATLRDVVLNCLDVVGRLDTLPGFPQSVETHAFPQNWLEMKNPNMDRYLDYLFRWHSTAFENAYYTPSGTGSDYPFVVLGSDGESLWDQVQRRAGAIVPGYRLTCNRNGELRVLPDPILQEVADRTATSQVFISADDWTAVNWEYTRPPRVHWLRGEAILAHVSEIAAVFCNAPGTAPGQGESEQTSGEQLAKSQTDLNNKTGHEYARLNAYNGLVPVSLPDDNDRIQPADMTWVTLGVSGDYAARRGLGFSSDRGLPVELNISYEYGRSGTVKTVEMLWEQETVGIPAVTYIPPEVDWDPPWTPPPNPFPAPDPTPTGQGDGFGTNYVAVDAVLGRTRVLSAASPSWVNITDAITGTVQHFILDPYSPLTTSYATSTDGFWKSSDLDQVSPTWTQIRSVAQLEAAYGLTTFANAHKISASINVPGFVAFWHQLGTQLCCTITTDGGTTWSYNIATVGGTAPDTSRQIVNFRGSADYVPHLISGQVHLVAAGKDGTGNGWFFRSNDSGATWSEVNMGDFGAGAGHRPVCMHVPYDDNPTGQIIYLIVGSGSSGDQGLWKTTNGGANWTQLNTSYSEVPRHGVESFTGNRLRLFHWRQNNTLWLSTDGGDNWTQATAAGISGAVRAAGGFPYNNQQYYVLTSTGIFVSTDNGESFTSKNGDWAFGFTISDDNGIIVPVWVPE